MIDLCLFQKRYDASTYNCAHFLRDSWLSVTGEDLSIVLSGFLSPKEDRAPDRKLLRRFERLENAVSPCVVMMRHGVARPHVGMFLEGRLLQIQENGVTWLPLQIATAGYPNVRFYK